MKKEFKNLSERMIRHNNPTGFFEFEDLKEFIELRDELDEKFLAQITGLVWGLNIEGREFDLKYFNNRLLELFKENNIEKKKLAGSKLVEGGKK